MQSILKFIALATGIFGVVLFTITFLGLRKLIKEHKKQNNDDILSDIESRRYRQYLIYMLAGFCISVITSLINLMLLFCQ